MSSIYSFDFLIWLMFIEWSHVNYSCWRKISPLQGFNSGFEDLLTGQMDGQETTH